MVIILVEFYFCIFYSVFLKILYILYNVKRCCREILIIEVIKLYFFFNFFDLLGMEKINFMNLLVIDYFLEMIKNWIYNY